MAEEAKYSHDPKFRQFVTSIDKALRSFESTSEWADLISALGKLAKALQSHTQFPIIPKKYTIGKRLSQCTHPALPSGCHLKALEVYHLIFQRIGSSGLAHDIFVYATGLFPLLGNSAMSVRPYLLSIYEKHFLPLGHHLSPALQGLVLALLPGLEEGSEHTDRIHDLLISICNCTDKWLFHNALWSCVLNVPLSRLPALTLLLSEVNKDATAEDQQYLFGDDLVTMVKGLSAALTDSVVLVQRSALDILVALLPLHQEFFQRADTVLLLRSALLTLLRRDMSLSRRLYTWLLGHSGKSSESQARKHDYFIRYSRSFVISALRSMILDTALEEEQRKPAATAAEDSSEPQNSKLRFAQPIRIMVALLDKEDLGYLCMDDLILDVIQALHKICVPSSRTSERLPIGRTASRSAFEGHTNTRSSAGLISSKTLDELRLQMQSFFDLITPAFIWKHLALCFHELERLADDDVVAMSRTVADTSGNANGCSNASNSSDLQSPRRTSVWSLASHGAAGAGAGAGANSAVHGEALNPTAYSMDELVELASFLLSFMPLELLLDLRDGTLQLVFCHCMRALRRHCASFNMSTIRKSILLCSKLLARSPPASSPAFALSQIWPDLPSPRPPPRLSSAFLSSMQDEADTEETSGEAASLDDVQLQFPEACLHYAQSFFSTLAKHCLRCLHQGSGTTFTLPAFESIVQESISSRGRLFKLSSSLVAGDTLGPMNEAFAACCRLLIDLSATQIFALEGRQSPSLTGRIDSDPAAPFPKWLHLLVACTCNCPSFQLASSAVSCLLQLSEAAHNALLHHQTHGHRQQPADLGGSDASPMRTASASLGDEGNSQHITEDTSQADSSDPFTDSTLASSLEMLMLSKGKDILHLRQTHFFQGLAALLWRELDHCSVEQQSFVAQMLCQLNGSSLAPGALERVMCSDFSNADMSVSLSAHKRFALLWHLSFEDDFASNSPHLERAKLFLRPLNFMLDGLVSRHSWCRALAHAWLEQVLYARDLHRLLQPLLLALLTPNSARVRRMVPSPALLQEDGEVRAASYSSPLSSQSSASAAAAATTPTSAPSTAGALTSSSSSSSMYTSLVYVRPHDTAVSVYALKSLLNVVRAKPHLLVTQAAGCQLPNGSLCQGVAALDELLIKHEMSISGNAFDTAPGKGATSRRSYFEVLLTVLSWTMESTFTDEQHQSAEMLEQLELLQVTSVEVLVALLGSCASVLEQERTSSNASYIHALLQMCIFHRSFLTCLAKSMVPSVRKKMPSFVRSTDSEAVAGSSVTISASQKAFHLLLLELAEVVLRLEGLCEEQLSKESAESEERKDKSAATQRLLDCTEAVDILSRVDGSMVLLCRLARQPAFHGMLGFVLTCPYLASVHCRWLSLLSKSVAHLGPARIPLITTAVNRVAQWLLHLVHASSTLDNGSSSAMQSLLSDAPPFYLPSLLRSYASVLHYALLGMQPVEMSSISAAANSTAAGAGAGGGGGSNPLSPSTSRTSVPSSAVVTSPGSPPPVSSWAYILPFGSSSQQLANKSDKNAAAQSEPVREATLNSVNKVMQALVDVWCLWASQSSAGGGGTGTSTGTGTGMGAGTTAGGPDYMSRQGVTLPAIWGSSEHVSHQTVSVIYPLGLYYPVEVLLAFAEVWLLEQKGQPILQLGLPLMVDTCSRKQELILSMMTELQCFGCEVLLTIGKRILSSKPLTAPLEECLFHLLIHAVKRTPALELQRCWPVFYLLLKQCVTVNMSSISPPRLFLSTILLLVYLERTPQVDDRKLKREIQDISQRCLDGCVTVVGSSLENTAWLRRSMAITASHQETATTNQQSTDVTQTVGVHPVNSDDSVAADTNSHEVGESRSSLPDAEKTQDLSNKATVADGQAMSAKAPKASVKLLAVYSPQALQCLSRVLATIVDIVYGSEEKDRAVAVLSNMMVYILPFLKTRSSQNLVSSTAAIHLLSTVSEFHYTRRAWRREITELFFDSDFFCFDSSQLASWCSVIDNLLGHDKHARQELLGRVSISQSGLNLFTSSDMEMQQRAHLLKRLSFAIFSSPKDQYETLLPDIQERLSECLRLQMAPIVHQQVFLCWRVLLVRMSPTSLTAFWPVMMTELIQVLLQLEQDLVVDATKMISQSNDPWLGLYMSACKLLDLVLALPSSALPQFQMYQWAFVGGQRRQRRIIPSSSQSSFGPADFEPYMIRLVDLLDQPGLPDCEPLQQPFGRPLLTIRTISSVLQLKAFVLGLVRRHLRTHSNAGRSSSSSSSSINDASPATGVLATVSSERVSSGPASASTSKRANSASGASVGGTGNIRSLTNAEFIERLIGHDFLESGK
ncbi:protein dopey-1 homolog isoform X2 [Sycon ciliatum]|uniref:protein dopey-1 homolog isoform X2 n=1 Tax=Sycon ciliatum TaxID=27933 RepID=UPI0031F665B3